MGVDGLSQLDNQTGTRSISVEMWHILTQEGMDLPVHIQLQGCSMSPLIRRRRDYVTIRPIRRPLMQGDIVLFRRPEGVYVVHRVWKMTTDMVQTLGDNCHEADTPVPRDAVLGLVTHVTRGRHTFCVDTPMWRFLGRCWSALQPLRRIRRILFDALNALFRRFRR